MIELLENHAALITDDKDSAETLVSDCRVYFPSTTSPDILLWAETEPESDTVDWRKLSPYDLYFQQDLTVLKSSLPVHSIPELDCAWNRMGSWIKQTIAIFTPLESLESIHIDSDFKHIHDRLAREWQQTSTWIIGIIGINIAAYTLGPDSLFQVSQVGKVAIGASGLTISMAALCDLYLLSHFSSLEPLQFQAAVTDVYDTFVCFSILSRVPHALVILSMSFLATLLIEVAYWFSPTMTLIIRTAITTLPFLQYIVMALDWMVWILVTLVIHFLWILKAVCQWLVFHFQRVFQLPVSP